MSLALRVVPPAREGPETHAAATMGLCMGAFKRKLWYVDESRRPWDEDGRAGWSNSPLLKRNLLCSHSCDSIET